jgi:hypothetical protein
LAATHADRTWKRAHGTNILPLPSVPQVIETRVLGLNAFLQMVLSSPTYATSTDLVDFLERERNLPPPGLDLILDEAHPLGFWRKVMLELHGIDLPERQ